MIPSTSSFFTQEIMLAHYMSETLLDIEVKIMEKVYTVFSLH